MAESKMSAEYWATAEAIKEIYETKLCLAKAHSSDPCEGRIIDAHSIPRSQLAKIAIDGHVHAIRANAADLARNDGELTAKQVGIGTFSVLKSFCASHDNNVFARIEDEPLVFDPHQLTLLHYRTMATELYRKAMSYHALLHQLEEQSKKKKTRIVHAIMESLRLSAASALLGMRDIGISFTRSGNNLRDEKYDDISALVVHFKKRPSVMTVGSLFPLYDYHGKPLQLIYDTTTIPQTTSFNIVVADDHAVVAMLWFKDNDLIKKFAETFVAQKSEYYATLAIQSAFEYLETTCMHSGWWNGLRPVVQRLLLNRMHSGISAHDMRNVDCLVYGGVTFDQWDYDRHEWF